MTAIVTGAAVAKRDAIVGYSMIVTGQFKPPTITPVS